MPPSAPTAARLLLFAAATGCATYAPAPVDLPAHAAEFAARLPDAAAVRAFLQALDGAAPATPSDEAIDLASAHAIALWFNADLRLQRLRAGVETVAAEHAGRLADPSLDVDLARILRDAAHPWIAAGSLGLSVPLTSRLGAERRLAAGESDRAREQVRADELRVLDALDTAWVQWSAAQLRVEALRADLRDAEALAEVAARLLAAQELNNVAARAFQLEVATRKEQLMRAEGDLAAAALHRNELLGLPPDRELPFVPTLALALRCADPTARAAALVDGPLLRLAQQDHEVAERRLELAIAGQWPDLALLPGFGSEDGQPRALFSLSLPLPLWNGNALAIARARAERDVAAGALQQVLERATAALAHAEAQLRAASQLRAHVDRELVPLAASQLTDSRRLGELGRLDPVLLLDSLGRISASKLAAIDAALAEATATATLNALFWPESRTPKEPR